MIDEEGRIFGTVNIIDAIVVVVVFAVLVSGVALVYGGGGHGPQGESATRYATVSFGPLPSDTAGFLAANESELLTSGIELTDTYVTPTAGSEEIVYARLKLHGRTVPNETLNRSIFRYRGELVRTGDKIGVETVDFAVNGSIISVSESGATLPTEQTVIVVESPIRPGITIERGDEYTFHGREVATVRNFSVQPTETQNRSRLILELGIQTISLNGKGRFAGVRLQSGNSVPFVNDDYSIDATIISSGDSIHQSTTNVTIKANVSRHTGRLISPGDAFRTNGVSVATVTDVRFLPTLNRSRQTVWVDLTLNSCECLDTNGESFAGKQLRPGTSIPLRTNEYALNGEIIQVEGAPSLGEPENVTVTVSMEDVDPNIVESIQPGMTERRDGVAIATITDRTIEPAKVTVISDDGHIYGRTHPYDKDITLTVKLRARANERQLFFRGEPLRVGNRILIQLDHITITGNITQIQDQG